MKTTFLFLSVAIVAVGAKKEGKTEDEKKLPDLSHFSWWNYFVFFAKDMDPNNHWDYMRIHLVKKTWKPDLSMKNILPENDEKTEQQERKTWKPDLSMKNILPENDEKTEQQERQPIPIILLSGYRNTDDGDEERNDDEELDQSNEPVIVHSGDPNKDDGDENKEDEDGGEDLDPSYPPSSADILKEFEGSVDTAFKAFLSLNTIYESEAKDFKKSGSLFYSKNFNKKRETIFIFGALHSSSKDLINKNFVMAIAMRNMLKYYNVFVVSLTRMNASIEKNVVRAFFGGEANYDTLGTSIARYFQVMDEKDLLDIKTVHLVGYCYSGRLAGYIAKYIKEFTNKKIKSILALDPYTMGLAQLRRSRLTDENAETVHVYHTNNNFYGTTDYKATADFVFNNGNTQPLCDSRFKIQDVYFPQYKARWTKSGFECSHAVVVEYLYYIILYPTKFLARKCSSWKKLKKCECKNENMPTTSIPFPPAKGPEGTYFLYTTDREPFGEGKPEKNC